VALINYVKQIVFLRSLFHVLKMYTEHYLITFIWYNDYNELERNIKNYMSSNIQLGYFYYIIMNIYYYTFTFGIYTTTIVKVSRRGLKVIFLVNIRLF